MSSRLEAGISLAQVSPDLDFWSDASDMGWRAHLADEVASGLWPPEDALLQNWGLIPQVLKKLRSSSGVLMTLIAPFWPQRPWFPDMLDLVVDGPVQLPLSPDLLRQPHFHCRHLGIHRLSLHAWRQSSDSPRLKASLSRVASQIGFARRASSRMNYQVKWSVYRQWCHAESHSISQPLLPKIADFLFWLRRSRKLPVSSILGYCSILLSVFRCKLPENSSSSVLKDLLRTFKVKAPVRSIRPPPWDLDVVLRFLISSTFEPLASTSLRSLTKNVLFLVSLATAKCVGELQALSRYVSFSSSGAYVAYVPEFLAKTESALHPLPRSFLVKSLTDFVAGLDQELLLCPVRALIVLVVFLYLLVLRLVRCPRMVSCISYERSFMRLALAGRLVFLFVLIALGESLPILLFTRIGRSQVSWMQLHGDPIWCLLRSTSGSCSSSMRVFAR